MAASSAFASAMEPSSEVGAAAQLQGLLDELHITSLDESDIEAGLRDDLDLTSDLDADIDADASALEASGLGDVEATSVSGGAGASVLGEEEITSTESATTSVEGRAVGLGSDALLAGDAALGLGFGVGADIDEDNSADLAALEARLRLGGRSGSGGGALGLAAAAPAAERLSATLPLRAAAEQRLQQQLQQQLQQRQLQQQQLQQQQGDQVARAVEVLAREQEFQSREMAELRREGGARRREAFLAEPSSALAPAPLPVPASAATTGGVPAATAPATAAAAAVAAGVFRLRMSDLDISEAAYQALRQRPEDGLNVREWVQLRFFEARGLHKAEVERLRKDAEALRENLYSAGTRAERAERQLSRRDAAVTDLTQELDRQQQQSRAQHEQDVTSLRACERRVEELLDKGRRFDEVAKEAERLREEMQSLRDAMSVQSAAHQQLGKEHADASERLAQLEADHRLSQRDAESHERRARLLEDTLARRDEEAAELRAKVESLREKKRELARRAAAEQTDAASEVREQVNAEIKRFQEQAHADLEAVRTNLNNLHEREVQMLQERIEAGEARIAELHRRLEDEEHAHQALQLSSGRVRAELQNEITELTGALKLRAFEAERAALSSEEVSKARQQLAVENEQLRQQVDVLRKEYYTLEVQHREGRAAERAELASLREQLRGYVEVERELDAAIRACAEGPQASAVAASGMAGAAAAAEATVHPQTVEEALLVGTTLASAPTSSQRRIQQSLLLAQELQKRTREAAQAKAALSEAESEVARLREELEVSRAELRYSSEPQAYLLEALRRREGDVLALRRDLKARDVEVEQARKQVEHAVTIRLQVEEDLKKLLAQREHLSGLKAVLDGHQAQDWDVPMAEAMVPRAEHRGRAPCQQPSQQPQGTAPRAPGAPGGGEALPPTGAASGPVWFQRLRRQLEEKPPDG